MHADLTRMLLDPLPLLTGNTGSAAFTGFEVSNFARISDGVYVGTNVGTNSEPRRIVVTNRMNYLGTSTITFKQTRSKAVAAVNGVPQKNAEASASVQFVVPHAHFSNADMLELLNGLCGSAQLNSLGNSLLRGEK